MQFIDPFATETEQQLLGPLEGAGARAGVERREEPTRVDLPGPAQVGRRRRAGRRTWRRAGPTRRLRDSPTP